MLQRILVGFVPVLAMLLWSAGVARADLTAVEGQRFSGPVVDIGGGCGLASAAIDWGDGTTSAGASDGGTGVQGTHIYADEGTYRGTVAYTCLQFGGPQQAPFQATVLDASLSGSGRALTGTAGQALNTVVAHVDDANPGAGAGDLSAQIAWGDGATTTATLASAAAGGFDVSGAHAYAGPGNYTLTVTVTDIGASTATANSTTQIAPPPPPPPPPPPGPQAEFTFSPGSPCTDDQVSFDASASTGELAAFSTTHRLPIRSYRWSIYDPTSVLASHAALEPFVTTQPTLGQAFAAAYYTIGPYTGHLHPDNYNYYFDYRFFRPPVLVTLQVTDSLGETASTTRRITFADPDVTRQLHLGFAFDAFANVYTPDFSTGRQVYYVDVPPYVDPGFPACDAHARLHKALSQQVDQFGQSALGRVIGLTPTTISVKSPCRWALGECIGSLEVLVIQGARAGRSGGARRTGAGRSIVIARGSFFVPARRTGTVRLPLNARGRALARAHKLHTLTLRLTTRGANGKTVTMSRTVRTRPNSTR